MPHGLNKNKSKVISSDKLKTFKFTREPKLSKPFWETQKGESIFVSGNVKAKKTLGDSDKFSNILNERHRRRPRHRKVDQFALYDQKLEKEKDKRKQGRYTNWKK